MTEPVNFRVVDADRKIFRGGQPANQSEWDFVASLGVRQVIKLNLESEAQDSTWLITHPEAGFIYIPITDWQQIVTEPELSQLQCTLDLWLPEVPTYIHCEHGINRTGLLCALYRVKFNGWTAQTALQEWHGYGAIAIEQEGLEKAFADLVPQLFPKE